MKKNNIVSAVSSGRAIPKSIIIELLKDIPNNAGGEDQYNLWSKLLLSDNKAVPLEKEDILKMAKEVSLSDEDITGLTPEDHSDIALPYMTSEFVVKASALLSNRSLDCDLVDVLTDSKYEPIKQKLKAFAALANRRNNPECETEEQKQEAYGNLEQIILSPDNACRTRDTIIDMLFLQEKVPLDLKKQLSLVQVSGEESEVPRSINLARTSFSRST